MNLLVLLVKDARLLLRNRALLVALVLYPLLLAGTLAAAFQQAPTTLDLAIYDADEGGGAITVGGERIESSTLVDAAGSYARVHKMTSEADAIGAVRRGEVDAALVIPQGFMRDLARLGGNATLRLVVDESDAVRAGIARNAVTGGIDSFLRSVVTRKVADVEALLNITVTGGTTGVGAVQVDVLGIDKARARLEEVRATLDPKSAEAQKVADVVSFLDFARSVLGNADSILTTTALPIGVQTSGLTARETGLAAIALPGAAILGIFWTGALAAALLASRERESGTARRLAAAPGPRVWSALSKTSVALVAALAAGILLLAAASLLQAGVVEDPALTALVLVCAALAAAALGGLCAGLSRGSSSAALLVVLLLLPMLLLGGLFYPIAYMPSPVREIASILPVTTATDALRGAMLRGSALAEIALPLGGLVVFAFLAALGGALLARRRA